MGALDVVVRVLESQPRAVRHRFTIRRDGQWASIQRGAMQVAVRELGDGTVEVAYEQRRMRSPGSVRNRISPPGYCSP